MTARVAPAFRRAPLGTPRRRHSELALIRISVARIAQIAPQSLARDKTACDDICYNVRSLHEGEPGIC